MNAWPYEELKLELHGDVLKMHSPWFARSQKVDGKRFHHAFGGPGTPAEQAAAWAELYAANPFDPIYYLIPRAAIPGLDVHEPGRETLTALERAFLAGETGLSALHVSKVASRDWDTDAALEFCRISGTSTYDPLSLFSACRRFYYLDALEFDQTIPMYDFALSLKGTSAFRKAAALIAFQNFEVTRRCQEVLLPALKMAQSSHAALESFAASEKGHDVLLRRGLVDLGCTETKPLAITNLLLDAFALTARTNFLSFAFTVSLFEEASPEGADPLTKLLLDGGEADAAKAFQRHCDINDGGHHDHIGLALLEPMAAVSEPYAREAFALCEGISKIVNVYTSGILKELGVRFSGGSIGR